MWEGCYYDIVYTRMAMHQVLPLVLMATESCSPQAGVDPPEWLPSSVSCHCMTTNVTHAWSTTASNRTVTVTVVLVINKLIRLVDCQDNCMSNTAC